MPDIVSRIKVQADGADAAAREIRKLKAAYEEVGVAARNLSPSTGGADPFTAATTAPGGGIVGGQRSPAQVNDQVRRNDEWANQAFNRLQNNQSFPARTGGSGLSVMSGAQNAMMAGGQGQYAQAAGGASSMLGGLLGGPAGWALMAGGVAAAGVQKLSNNEMERIQRIYGSGQAQRLGLDYTTQKNWEMTQGFRGGIPMETIQAFMSTASQSGVSRGWLGKAGTAADLALEANARLGLDASASATLLGGMARSGLSSSAANYDMYTVGRGAFGNENLSQYIGGLTQYVGSQAGRGVNVTPEAFQSAQTMMAGLVDSGLSTTGAVALTQRLTDRGVAASGMTSPEDLLALTALRSSGMSLTDAQIAMEEDPTKVIGAVYGRLQSMYGGNDDAMNLALRKYTGGTMSETVRLREYLDSGKTYDDYKADGMGWLSDDTYDSERNAVAVSQGSYLRGLETSAQHLTEAMGNLAASFRGGTDLQSIPISFGDMLEMMPVEIDHSDLDRNRRKLNALDRDPALLEGMTGVSRAFAESGIMLDDEINDILNGKTGMQQAGMYTNTWDVLGYAMAEIKSQTPRGSAQRDAYNSAEDIISAMAPDQLDEASEVTAALYMILQAIREAGLPTDGDDG